MLCDGSAFTRDTQRGLEPSLSLGVAACGNRTIDDRDAAAYIAAVEAAKGSPVTVTQSRAIFDFIKAEKLAARWDSAGRIYLPIWGVAAANAICLKSLSSGTFVGGITHASGYIQGNGTSGYFSSESTLADAGASGTSQMGFVLSPVADTTTTYKTLIVASTGAVFNTPGLWMVSAINDQMRFDSVAQSQFFNLTRTLHTGVIVNSRVSNTSWFGRIRRGAGASSLFTGPTVDSNGLASGKVSSLGPAHFSNARIGCLGFRSGLSTSETDDYTLNLKNLWETCTGLTLP